MKKLRKTAAALWSTVLAVILSLSLALPAFAAFDQSVLDGVVLLYSGAPVSCGVMQYWRVTGFLFPHVLPIPVF